MLRSKVSWTVEYYEQQNGCQPSEQFEDSLPMKLAGKLARVVVLLCEDGPGSGGGLVEKCRGYPGLWELRTIWQKDLAREFFGFDRQRIVLLDGIVKRVGHPTPGSVLAPPEAGNESI